MRILFDTDILMDFILKRENFSDDAEKLTSALQNDDFTDFEDCLQAECAKDFEADYIVTRNIKDFCGSAVHVIEPLSFIKKF